MERHARRRLRDQRGAAAVEFALVSIVLFPLIFGMVQYGLFFNDSLQAKQGLREGARISVTNPTQASLASTAGGTTCPATLSYLNQVACVARSRISPTSGKVWVKVVATSWTVGQPLVVCSLIDSAADTVGVVPVPDKGFVRTSIQMSIEQNTTTVTAGTGYADGNGGTSATAPTGATWPC